MALARGSRARVTVTLSEALSEAPTLTAEGGEHWLLADAGSDAQLHRYGFTYVASGAEAEVTPTLTLVAVDGSGNRAALSFAGPRFDFTAPVAGEVTWSAGGKRAVRRGDVVTFAATTESGVSLVSARAVGLDGAPLAELLASVEAGGVAGSFVVVPWADAVQVELRLTDEAGNVTPAGFLRSAPIVIDDAAPTGGSLEVEARTATPFVLVRVRGNGASAIRFGGPLLEADQWLPLAVPGTIGVTLTGGVGQKTLTAELADEAGNVAALSQPVTTLYDPLGDDTPPRVLVATATSATTVRLAFSEAMSPGDVVALVRYRVEPPLALSAATYDAATQSVTLTTAEQVPGRSYLVVIDGARDLVGLPLDQASDAVVFTGFGAVAVVETLQPESGAILVDDGSEQVRLSWSPRSGTTAYALDVFADVALTQRAPGYAASVVVSSASAVLTLPVGRSYFWRVRSDTNVPGVHSAVASFGLVGSVLAVYCPAGATCVAGSGQGTVNSPFASLGAALAFAAGHPRPWTIAVAARGGGQAYDESVVLPGGLVLRGGYDPTFAEAARDPALNPTTLRSSLAVTVLVEGVTAAAPVTLEGLRILAADSGPSYAVFARGCSDGLTLRDLALQGSTLTSNSGESYALYMVDSGTSPATAPLVEGCVITGASSGKGDGAVRLERSSPTLRRCTLTAGAPSGPAAERTALVSIDGSPLVVESTLTAPPGGSAHVIRLRAGNASGATPVLSRSRVVGGGGASSAVFAVEVFGNARVVDTAMVVGPSVIVEGVTAFNAPGDTANHLTISSSMLLVDGNGSSGGQGWVYGVRLNGAAHLRLTNSIVALDGPHSGTLVALLDGGGDPDGNPGTPDLAPAVDSLQHNAILGFTYVFQNGGTCPSSCASTQAALNTASLVVDGAAPPAAAASGNVGDETVAGVGGLALLDLAARDLHFTLASPAAVTRGGKDVNQDTCGVTLDGDCGDAPLDLDGMPRPGADGFFAMGPYEP